MKILRKICLLAFAAISLGAYAQTTTIREMVLQLKGETEPISFNVEEIDSVTFSEKAILPDAPFTISVSDIAPTEATVTVTPESDAPYYFNVITRSNYEEVNGDLTVIMKEFIEFLQTQYPGSSIEEITSMIQSRGESSDVIPNLEPETEYYAFAIGLNNDGTCSTPAQVELFKTTKPGNPQDCKFELEMAFLSNSSAKVQVTPTDNGIRYYFDIVPAEDYPGDVTMINKFQLEMQDMATQYNIPLVDVVNAMSHYGRNLFENTQLIPQTDYIALAYAINDDASAAGILYKLNFTTPITAVSDIEFNISCPKYFDGDELYALDPVAYANFKGKVIVPAKAEVNPDIAQHWYVGLAAGDLSDETLYPDDSAISALVDMQGGVVDKLDMLFKANWGTATFLGVAQDEFGVFSKLIRLVIDFNKEDAAPASEYEPAATSAYRVLEIGKMTQPQRLSNMK